MHSPARPVPDSGHRLSRALGLRHAISIVVGTIIGSGIFLVPKEMMQAVGSAKLVYLAWIVGGVLSTFGALTYAELGALKPQAGGEYVYVRDGYGPLAGFLYAWTWFVIAKPASIATITTGLMRILGTFESLSFLQRDALHAPISITWAQVGAMLATIAISALNYIGVRKAGDFQYFFTWLKVLMIAAIVGVSFSFSGGTFHNFASNYAGATGGISGFMLALVAALWAYDGWNDLNMVSEEIEHPERNIPLGLIVGVLMVAALYMLTNAAVQYVLPATQVAGSDRPASEAMRLAVGAAGAMIVSAGMALSMLVGLNGTVMSGGRVPFAVARDGYFFHALAKVHPRFLTPGNALIVQAALSCGLLLIVSRFQQLFSIAIFAEWLFYMIAASTIFIFRRRMPDATRPYRTWGYPVVPAVFIVAAALLLYSTFTENLKRSLWGSAVILAGLPVFWFFKAIGNRQSASSSKLV
ncbi:MAG: amino acid permease [Acidobacteria bacterium]|nr:amino acid permease [Acidobacteriota bacterium]